MAEELIERAFLFGLDHLKIVYGISSDDSKLIEAVSKGHSQLVLALRFIISNLISSIDIGYLANSLQITPFFLLLLNENASRSGNCLICNLYFTQLDQHFTSFHKQDLPNYFLYRKLFGPSVESYWPFKSSKKKSKIKSLSYFTGYATSSSNLKNSKKNTELSSNKHRKLQDQDNVKRDVDKKTNNFDNERQISAEKIQNGDESSKKKNENSVKTAAKSSSSLGHEKKQEEVKFSSISPESLSKEETFTCDICSQILRLSNKSTHMSHHRRYEVLQCPMCGESYKRRYKTKHERKCPFLKETSSSNNI